MISERDQGFYTQGGWGDSPAYVTRVVVDTIDRYEMEPGRLLDAACGDGRFAQVFHELGFQVDAFDISADAVDTASRFFPGPVYTVADAELRLPWRDTFDYVWCRGISHTGYPRSAQSDAVFQNLHDALKPGGLLILERNTDGTGIVGPSRYFSGLRRGNPTAEDLVSLIVPFFTIESTHHLDDRIQVSARR